MAATDLPAALKMAVPLFGDSTDGLDTGAAVFGLWATSKLTWAELQAVPETRRGRVMKDSIAERGKRMCVSGRIIEINVDRSSGPAVYLGGMMDNGSNVYRLVAVKDTGDLVERSTARFCGIVTGTNSYANSGGGTTHAVQLVGMFDLPENRK